MTIGTTQLGAIESVEQAASYTDVTAATVDYDATDGYAQVVAKAAGSGASLGLRLRAIVAGTLTDLLDFAAGGVAAVFGGGVTIQQGGLDVQAGSTALQATTAASINTASGVLLGCLSGTWYSAYMLPAAGVYRLYAFIPGAGALYWLSTDIVYDGVNAAPLNTVVGSASIAVQVISGAIVQLKEASGGTDSINWYIVRLG